MKREVKTKAGKPAKESDRCHLRFEPGQKAVLQKAATKNRRSLNAEILHRLFGEEKN